MTETRTSVTTVKESMCRCRLSTAGGETTKYLYALNFGSVIESDAMLARGLE